MTGKMISDDNSKLNFCLQICQAIEYIHSKQIVHLDIKSSNILVDQQEIEMDIPT
jgi:serine/threonine protein kinase